MDIAEFNHKKDVESTWMVFYLFLGNLLFLIVVLICSNIIRRCTRATKKQKVTLVFQITQNHL